jgi:hypothetical protein
MVTEGLFFGTGLPGPDGVVFSRLYAVPSDGVLVELTTTNPTTAIPVLSNWEAAMLGGVGEIDSRFNGRLVAWVP